MLMAILSMKKKLPHRNYAFFTQYPTHRNYPFSTITQTITLLKISFPAILNFFIN